MTKEPARSTTILIIVVQALACLAITYWVGRLEGIESSLQAHKAWATETVVDFEGRVTATEKQGEEILRRLERIESKLDRLDSPKVK